MRGLHIVTKTYTCPDLTAQADGIDIERVLLSSPGVEEVEADFRTGKVRVVLVDADAEPEVLTALDNAGYPPASD